MDTLESSICQPSPSAMNQLNEIITEEGVLSLLTMFVLLGKPNQNYMYQE